MKVLYAAGNNFNAHIQLSRFLWAMQDTEHQIKIAAYKKSSPKNVSVNWTLDCLLNIFDPQHLSLENDNLQIYYQQIKDYAPDLVISDLEYFTSYVANLLDLTLWQCSSSTINYGLVKNQKYNSGISKLYGFSINRNERHTQRTINLLVNSSRNFVYSHFGDLSEPPQLQENYQWVRPYHQIGKSSIPCQHHIVAGIPYNNKSIIHQLKKYPDSVVFTDFAGERFDNLLLKNIENQAEYYCNLRNSPLFLCQGQTSFLADAFYNGKYALIYPDYQDPETVLNSCLTQHYQMGAIVNPSDNLDEYLSKTIVPSYNSIKYLHQHIQELS
jgi:uncharacterized protein (TIGR00661 family)